MEALSEVEQRFARSDAYRDFLRRRSRRAWSIVITALALAMTFLSVTQFVPGLANQTPLADSELSLGILMGLFSILCMAVLALYFVIASNREHRQVHQDLLATRTR